MNFPDEDDFSQLPPLPEPEMLIETFGSIDYDIRLEEFPKSAPPSDDE